MRIADYRHVIWDWNGTLLDDVWLAVASMNSLLERRGMPRIGIGDYVRHFDFPVIAYYRRLGFDFGREPFETVAIEFIDTFEARRFECRLHPGAMDMLDTVRRAGLTQSVLSATQHDSLMQYVDHFGIGDRFEQVMGLPDHYAHGKTALARQWMDLHEWRPGDVLFVGDTVHDAEVARAIRVDCVLIAHGHQPREKLLTTGMPVIRKYSDLL